MSQVMITCPRCKEKFKAEEADIYECPFCGTNIRPKQDTSNDLEKTQQFET
jgi:rRNA maturation endonuclease Nob1